jgi:hypothetical protein
MPLSNNTMGLWLDKRLISVSFFSKGYWHTLEIVGKFLYYPLTFCASRRLCRLSRVQPPPSKICHFGV